MNVQEAIEQRTTVRAFTSEEVPRHVVVDLLERAGRAPSGGNLQPWLVHAVSGEPLEELKQLVGRNPAGEPPQHDMYPPSLWEPFRTRRYENGEQLYRALGIGRDDKPARISQVLRNGEFFGAPVGLFFCIDRGLGPLQWLDLGMFMQNVMLLALERGLATCPQAFWARHPETVATFLGLPSHHMVVAGMALGVRDDDHPINHWRSTRAELDEWCHLRGWEQDR